MRSTLPRLTGAAVLVIAALASPQEPRFSAGDLAVLACRVVRVEPVGFGFARLLVEVRNAGEVGAEPMVFRVTGHSRRGEAFVVEVARVAFPFANRFGRPTPARGKATYWLQVGAPDKGTRFDVAIARACFHDGAAVATPALRVGPLETTHVEADGSPVAASQVHIDNPLPQEIDAVFRATFTQPRDCEALLGVRLPAGSGRDWVIAELPAELRFDGWLPHQPVRVERLELIDWCLVGTGEPAAGRALLAAALTGWCRWPSPPPGVSGRFHHAVERDGGVEELHGTFRIDPAGAVEIALDAEPAGDGAARRRAVVDAITAAFADLRRPDPDRALAGGVRLVADGVVEVAGDLRGNRQGWRVSSGDATTCVPNYTVRDGRIAGTGDRSDLRTELWTTAGVPGGYVVTERRNPSGQWRERYGYRTVDDILVPTCYRVHYGMPGGGVIEATDLTLRNLRVERTGIAAAPAVPVGPGVDALRRAWDATYRYSAPPRQVSARFWVRNPGTDDVWLGQRLVEGSLRLDGFRGFTIAADGWDELQVEIAPPATEETRRGLAFALSDRLLMWSFRDFNGRGDFGHDLAGATVAAPTEAGVFAIRDGAYRSLTVRDGVIVRAELANGAVRVLSYAKVGDQRVVTRVQTGGEDLRARFRDLGNGLLVPVEIEMRGVFGADWGPETIRLTDVEAR